MDLVTIVLTTLHSEKFLARSLDSCLCQTYENLEVIIVDGGSKDRTLEIIASYHDPRLHMIHQRDNQGRLPGAINLGMALAQGDFITWTQDDSWFEPNAIEVMVTYLRDHPEVALVYADYWDVDSAGQRLRYHRVNTTDHKFSDDVIRQCFLFRREVYETIGPQDTRYFPVHETPWRTQLMERFRVEPLHIPLLSYTVHGDSLSGKIGARSLRLLMADYFLEQGYFDQKAYRRRLAEIDITEAYEIVQSHGSHRAFLGRAWSGIKQDLRWLGNLGLLKLILTETAHFLRSEWNITFNRVDQKLVDDTPREPS